MEAAGADEAAAGLVTGVGESLLDGLAGVATHGGADMGLVGDAAIGGSPAALEGAHGAGDSGKVEAVHEFVEVLLFGRVHGRLGV